MNKHYTPFLNLDIFNIIYSFISTNNKDQNIFALVSKFFQSIRFEFQEVLEIYVSLNNYKEQLNFINKFKRIKILKGKGDFCMIINQLKLSNNKLKELIFTIDTTTIPYNYKFKNLLNFIDLQKLDLTFQSSTSIYNRNSNSIIQTIFDNLLENILPFLKKLKSFPIKNFPSLLFNEKNLNFNKLLQVLSNLCSITSIEIPSQVNFDFSLLNKIPNLKTISINPSKGEIKNLKLEKLEIFSFYSQRYDEIDWDLLFSFFKNNSKTLKKIQGVVIESEETENFSKYLQKEGDLPFEDLSFIFNDKSSYFTTNINYFFPSIPQDYFGFSGFFFLKILKLTFYLEKTHYCFLKLPNLEYLLIFNQDVRFLQFSQTPKLLKFYFVCSTTNSFIDFTFATVLNEIEAVFFYPKE